MPVIELRDVANSLRYMSKKKVHNDPPCDTPARDDRYMGLAWMWASMSKDPSTQVGAIIISTDNRPLGSGYNGPPRAISDSEVNWVRPDKYRFITHAERNAIPTIARKGMPSKEQLCM